MTYHRKIVLLVYLVLCVFIEAAAAEQSTVEVYRHDGSIQCEPASGVPLDDMGQQLRQQGIAVIAARKGSDGRMYPMVCGAATGVVNIYRIDVSALRKAESLGFNRFE